MKRTFRGWLRRYCCALAGIDTTSIKKVCQAVCAAATSGSSQTLPALEAAFLYALDQGQAPKALAYMRTPELRAIWEEMLQLSEGYAGHAEAFLRVKYKRLSPGLQDVLQAFDRLEAQAAQDDHAVEELAKLTLEALRSTGITRYRLCKDLSLNEGNVYAWLAGDSRKISRASAERALRYAALFQSRKPGGT